MPFPSLGCVPVVLVLLLASAVPAQTLFPPPPVPPGNPMTPDKVLLGKALFFDEQLSSSRTVACATCHVLGTGGADPRPGIHPGPDGVFGTGDDIKGSPGVVQHDRGGRYVADPAFGIRPQVTNRRAPTVINAGYQPELFWDGRAGRVFADPVTHAVLLPDHAALENQVLGPPLSSVEMSHIGRSWPDVAADIAPLVPLALADQIPPALAAFVAGQSYAALFAQVFGSPGVTPARIAMAIATYERTLVSDGSRFDRFLAGQATLTAQETRGLQVFQALCSNCHTDTLGSVLATGPVLHDFRNIGVRPFAEDLGRFALTNQPADRGRFKVPDLRNVALRAPFFHNGGMATLADVVEFYARAGDFRDNLDPLVLNILGQLGSSDKAALVAFLHTLTDPRVQAEMAPFDRPRLWSEGGRVPSVFGVGTAGSGGHAPRSIAIAPPFVGNVRFALGVDRAAPGALHFLVWDVAVHATPVSMLGQQVHLAGTPALVLVGMPGPTLGTAPGGGHGSTVFGIPGMAALRGASFYGQWLVLDAAGPFGLTTSDAFGLQLF